MRLTCWSSKGRISFFALDPAGAEVGRAILSAPLIANQRRQILRSRENFGRNSPGSIGHHGALGTARPTSVCVKKCRYSRWLPKFDMRPEAKIW